MKYERTCNTHTNAHQKSMGFSLRICSSKKNVVFDKWNIMTILSLVITAVALILVIFSLTTYFKAVNVVSIFSEDLFLCDFPCITKLTSSSLNAVLKVVWLTNFALSFISELDIYENVYILQANSCYWDCRFQSFLNVIASTLLFVQLKDLFVSSCFSLFGVDRDIVQ